MARTKQAARKSIGSHGCKQLAAKRQLAMKSKRSQANCSTPSENVFQGTDPRTVPNSVHNLPRDAKIFVSGPCLHPEDIDPIASQREEFHTYFGQFGQITGIFSRKGKTAKIAFDNCDSVAKCLQQDKHKICGQDFHVRSIEKKKGLGKRKRKNKLEASLSQNMPGPSTENVSAANVQSDLPAESNLGNQSPQSTASSSSEGSVIYCGTVSGECPQSYGLADFDKPASTKEYIAAPVVWSRATNFINKNSSDLLRGYGYQ
ncbi:hypothetical protein Ddc_15782 [Ditylenchus destructor]|nr:hypothetical protein Ddc_15782 [Ditylenchus destructor]